MNDLLVISGGAVGAAMLYFGADLLVKGGVAIAEKLRIPSLVVGLTLVAFGTSAPELVVSILSALSGNGDISVGNVIGSNVCNLGLILGLCALIRPLEINSDMLKLDLWVLLFSAAVLGFWLYWNGGIGRIGSGILLLISAVYLSILFSNARKDRSRTEKAAAAPTAPIHWGLVWFFGGMLLLIAGAKLFVNGAVRISQLLGMSEAVIGITIVAFGTSLPELATSCVATIKGEDDIASGNIIGSNIWNILCIMGIAPLIRPIELHSVTAVDLLAFGVFTLSTLLILFSPRRISRWIGAAWLTEYLLYTLLLLAR